MRGDVNASLMEDGDWQEGAATDFDFVRFTVSDINGIPRSKLVPRRPRRHVDEKLRTGIGMDGSKSNVRQFCRYNYFGGGVHNVVGLDHRSCSTSGSVTAWMGDSLLTGKPSRYVTNHLGQLSLLE